MSILRPTPNPTPQMPNPTPHLTLAQRQLQEIKIETQVAYLDMVKLLKLQKLQNGTERKNGFVHGVVKCNELTKRLDAVRLCQLGLEGLPGFSKALELRKQLSKQLGTLYNENFREANENFREAK